MYTPLQISMKLKVTTAMVYQRIKLLELEPLKQVAHSRYYSLNDFYELKSKNTLSILVAKEKMLIIDYWSKMTSYKYNQEIADELGISERKLRVILIELRNNDNCITVKSKLC
jgi:hypothetical protein